MQAAEVDEHVGLHRRGILLDGHEVEDGQQLILAQRSPRSWRGEVNVHRAALLIR